MFIFKSSKISKYYIYLHYYYYRIFLRKKIDKVLELNDNYFKTNITENDERGFPGEKIFRKTGYYKYMIGRYLYSIKYIKNKKVIETASGLGWGSYLICDYTYKFDAFDIDEHSILFSKKHWPNNKVNYFVFDLNHLEHMKEKYDTILCFEFIEHLNLKNAITYLKNVYNLLNNSGVIIISSFFPKFKKQALIEQDKNPYHLHIFTKNEIIFVLKRIGFTKIFNLGNLIIVAIK